MTTGVEWDEAADFVAKMCAATQRIAFPHVEGSPLDPVDIGLSRFDA
jgi:hypothetical protein